jgi:hypothetical protein
MDASRHMAMGSLQQIICYAFRMVCHMAGCGVGCGVRTQFQNYDARRTLRIYIRSYIYKYTEA